MGVLEAAFCIFHCNGSLCAAVGVKGGSEMATPPTNVHQKTMQQILCCVFCMTITFSSAFRNSWSLWLLATIQFMGFIIYVLTFDTLLIFQFVEVSKADVLQ